MYQIAQRIDSAVTFQVMEILKKAHELKQKGHPVISLCIGEPDFTAPDPVVHALQESIQEGLSGYSPTLGIWPLRCAIAQHYEQTSNIRIDPARIAITAGASGALSTVCLTVLNPGDEILLPDPAYPPNRNFILCAGGVPKLIPTSIETRYQLSVESIQAHWGEKTKGVLIASPSNPTGTSICAEEIAKIINFVHERNGIVIMDEIYLGLSYTDQAPSALAINPNIIVINSFSKYFNMTGWRLGWAVLPEKLVAPFEKLSASLSICSSTPAQYAALACFKPETIHIYEQRRAAFKARRDYLIPELERLGIKVPVKPDGAFYIYCDVSAHDDSSWNFAMRLLNELHIATTPGDDFGPLHAKNMLRISYATSLENLKEVIRRLEAYL